ncbi:lytic transglycosylase domain-containing protein [Spelaeicoccus albus]|nr:lytic transglycosylase domain-containing protein [Spelaeicoccus albus]
MIRNSALRRRSGGALATTPLMVAAMLSAGAGHAPPHTDKAPDTPEPAAWTAIPRAVPADDDETVQTASWSPVGAADDETPAAQPATESSPFALDDSAAVAGGGSDYTVKSGDTVWSVARKLHLPVRQILRANGLSTHTLIFPGQKLKLSGSGPRAETAGASSTTYTVEAGDSLYAIALEHHTTVAALQKANDMGDSTMIRIGETLKLSGAGSSSGSKSSDSGSDHSTSHHSTSPHSTNKAPTTYEVKSGDTLFGIALKFHTTVDALQKANGMGDSTVVRTGQTLRTSSKKLPHVAKSFSGRDYPDETHHAAQINKDALLRANLPSSEAMQRMVAEVARAYGVDPALAQAVAYQESGFHMAVVSPANAIGTMQVVPSSGRWASGLAGRKLNLLSPKDNVTAGVVILKYLTTHAKKESKAIAGYYQGYSSVTHNGMYDDTRRYVNNVQTLKKRFT